MSIQDPEKKRAYEREWRRRKYADDPEYRKRKRATDDDWRRRVRQELRELKLERGCADCGYNRCAHALQFHHLENDKEFTIGSALTRGRTKLWAEIEKCVVLCATCHAERHCPVDC